MTHFNNTDQFKDILKHERECMRKLHKQAGDAPTNVSNNVSSDRTTVDEKIIYNLLERVNNLYEMVQFITDKHIETVISQQNDINSLREIMLEIAKHKSEKVKQDNEPDDNTNITRSLTKIDELLNKISQNENSALNDTVLEKPKLVRPKGYYMDRVIQEQQKEQQKEQLKKKSLKNAQRWK